MFEFDQYTAELHDLPRAEPELPYVPVQRHEIDRMSLMIWGEHCVECAAPSCFQTCDLYDRRPDSRCRRFEFGAFRNIRFPSLRGYGTEVVFKKWAKVEGRGNTRMLPAEQVLAREEQIGAIAPLVNSAGKIASVVSRNVRWQYASYALQERMQRRTQHAQSAAEGPRPDALLLEIYNPMAETVRLQVNVGLAAEESKKSGLAQLAKPFATTIELPPGYSRFSFDHRLFQDVTSDGKAFDVAFVPEADASLHLVFLSADFVKYAEKPATLPVSSAGLKDIKCVVFDLDNTLWSGILVEDDNVQLREGIADLLRHFDRRGLLLSVASKNTHQAAMDKLTQFGLADLFLYPQINWLPKSESVRRIASSLNLGLDTFAFVDDNPFELEEVGTAIPEVTCVHADGMPSLREQPRYQGSSSAEAKVRRQLYREAIVREEAQAECGSDYTTFLASCGITLTLSEYSGEDWERTAELVQRTNQLNFSGSKYKREELQGVLDNPVLRKYVMRVSDRFGSYGTVGFSIVECRPELVVVHDLMLSCRVQAKLIEQAFFHYLRQKLGEGTAAIWVNYKQTAKNQPARQVLEAMSFRPGPSGGESLVEGMYLPAGTDLSCDFITVNEAALSSG